MLSKGQIEVHDTYQAAYYYICGAKLIDAYSRVVPLNKREKYLFNNKWYITLSDVPEWAQAKWDMNAAIVNVRQLAAVRKKIKRFVKQNL